MSGPVSDDESSEQQKHSQKWSREHHRMPRAPQLSVSSPPMSPSHAQVQGDWGERSGSPPSGGDLENLVPRRPRGPEPVSQPQLQRPIYTVLRVISWIVIVMSCTALIVMIAIITKPFWQGSDAQSPPQASRLSDRLAANTAPVDSVTAIAA
jgi:hypothetical protein